jgi:hypothetical protein
MIGPFPSVIVGEAKSALAGKTGSDFASRLTINSITACTHRIRNVRFSPDGGAKVDNA